jgi:hypothetical protein
MRTPRFTPLFTIGKLILKPTDALETGLMDPYVILRLLNAHQRGNWGCVSDEEWNANEVAVREGGTIVSCHPWGEQLWLWIVTDTARSETTVLVAQAVVEEKR